MKDAFEIEYEKHKLEIRCAEAKLNAIFAIIFIVMLIGWFIL